MNYNTNIESENFTYNNEVLFDNDESLYRELNFCATNDLMQDHFKDTFV
jgi:hypothetical protein